MKPKLVVWKHLTLKRLSLMFDFQPKRPCSMKEGSVWWASGFKLMRLHVCLRVQNHEQTSTAANVWFILGKVVFLKYPIILRICRSDRHGDPPSFPIQFPRWNRGDADTLQDVSLQHLKEGSKSSAWMGHMEVVWAEEGVKAGAHHCWMLGMNLCNSGHLYTHSEPSDVRWGFMQQGREILDQNYYCVFNEMLHRADTHHYIPFTPGSCRR